MPTTSHDLAGAAVAYRAREAVALFDDYADLVAAIEELELVGFDRAQISLMRSCKAAEGVLGRPVVDVRELEDEPNVPLGGWFDQHELNEGKAALAAGLAYVGSLVAIAAMIAEDSAVLAILAAGAVGGGLAGAGGIQLTRLVGRRRTRELQEQLARGGILLWAETRSGEQERLAVATLARHATRDVHLHDLTHSRLAH
jgi:hypothetical protein